MRITCPVCPALALVPVISGKAGKLVHLRRRGELRRQGAHVVHRVDDVLVAVVQRPLRRPAVGRVVVVGRVDQRRESSTLLHRERAGRLLEVRARRGLDAVGTPSEVDRVEVALEDLLLRLLTLDLERQDRLLELAAPGALLREVEDLDVLLRDRRRALRVTAARVVERGPQDAPRVDALVRVEAAVLRCDHGVLDVRGHVGEVDADPVLVGELAEHRVAVGVVDEARLGLEALVGVRDVRLRVGDRERHQAEGEDREAHRRDPLDDASPPRGPLPLGLLARVAARLAGGTGPRGLLRRGSAAAVAHSCALFHEGPACRGWWGARESQDARRAVYPHTHDGMCAGELPRTRRTRRPPTSGRNDISIRYVGSM